MVNDILEQLAEDYFRDAGYFTQHNIKYKPNKKLFNKQDIALYSVHSDIDIIGVHPKKTGEEKVVVISCKSWQGGLRLKDIDQLEILFQKKDFRNKGIKIFKELFHPVWSQALINKVSELTGQTNFIFYLALTKYIGTPEEIIKWEKNKIFKKNLKNTLKIIDFKTMILHIQDKVDTTPAHSELSRLIQLIKAGKGKVIY